MDPLHALSLGDVSREQRSSYPTRAAVACGGTRLTYEELDARVNQLANGLLDRGVSQGDRVLWLAQNCHRILESLLACAKVGAMLAPANWRGVPSELAFAIEDLSPKVVI